MKLTPEILKTIERAHIEFLRDKNAFPKEWHSKFGRKFRLPILSYSEYWTNFMDAVSNDWDAFVTIYSWAQRRQRVVDTLFIDVDGPEKYLEDNYYACTSFSQRYGARLNFSATKGFHLYCDLPVPMLWDWLKKDIMKAVLVEHGFQFLDEDKPYYVDSACLREIARISRVPFTTHPKSIRVCIPVNYSWDFKDLIYFSENPQDISDWSHGDAEKTSDYLHLLDITNPPLDGANYQVKKVGEINPADYMWISRLMSDAQRKGRKRLLWLIVCPYLVNIMGYEPAEAFPLASDWLDRCNQREAITSGILDKVGYYLEYAATANLIPESPSSLRENDPQLYEQIKRYL